MECFRFFVRPGCVSGCDWFWLVGTALNPDFALTLRAPLFGADAAWFQVSGGCGEAPGRRRKFAWPEGLTSGAGFCSVWCRPAGGRPGRDGGSDGRDEKVPCVSGTVSSDSGSGTPGWPDRAGRAAGPALPGGAGLAPGSRAACAAPDGGAAGACGQQACRAPAAGRRAPWFLVTRRPADRVAERAWPGPAVLRPHPGRCRVRRRAHRPGTGDALRPASREDPR
jgi:hypothetical protein